MAFYSNIDQGMLGILPYAPFAGKNKFEKFFLNLGYNLSLGENWSADINFTNNSDILHIDADATGTREDHHQSLDYLGNDIYYSTDDQECRFGG
jgi:hypothetical protein